MMVHAPRSDEQRPCGQVGGDGADERRVVLLNSTVGEPQPVDLNLTARQRLPRWIVIAALVTVAANLRLLMASLPPLTASIRSDLGLDARAIGALTMIPVLCMGVLAPLSSRIGRRLGIAHAIGGGVTLVLLGTALRGLGGAHTWSLYAGTLTAGVGIALTGTLLPGLVKGFFPPERWGLGTGLTMFAMMGGAAIAAASSVPLASALGGWPASRSRTSHSRASAWCSVWPLCSMNCRPNNLPAQSNIALIMLSSVK